MRCASRWGGCIVSLVDAAHTDDHISSLRGQYYQRGREGGGLALDEGAVQQALFASPPAAGAAVYRV